MFNLKQDIQKEVTMDNNFGNNPQNNMPNGQNNLNNGNNKDDGNRKKQNIIIIVIAAIFTILAVSALTNLYTSATSEEITYDKFLDMIEKEQVESVVITTSGKIVITPKGSGDTKVGIKKTYYTTAIFVCQKKQEHGLRKFTVGK